MFTRILSSALLAGFCAGLVAAALQLLFVQPVLLHAELYESGALTHFGAAGAPPGAGGIELKRDALSVLFMALTYVGHALILVAGMSVAAENRVAITPRAGIVWGVAGFAASQLAPAFSLPPEVPGVAAADLAARQVWWWGTVAAAGAALALIAFSRKPLFWALAVALIVAPHLVGAPQPDSLTGPVPPEIAALFAARALGVGMAAWAVLGLLCAWFWQRETAGG
ncbi:cobalt transporter [Roseovarius spongiae]|uniref:Cobalt transporter n=1 Tax=Roseovarius spongiae TaxID=2320272 RepID=A0A3A8AUE5_9RHOB|nr:CbtA family protein [Roseovarius spongiae]RKF14658.1 cobalt transporter [Roseovarius spongiae]